MLIVRIKESEGIDRGLKQFKRKFEKTGVTRMLRKGHFFEKPCITRRNQIKHAVYVQQLRLKEEEN